MGSVFRTQVQTRFAFRDSAQVSQISALELLRSVLDSKGASPADLEIFFSSHAAQVKKVCRAPARERSKIFLCGKCVTVRMRITLLENYDDVDQHRGCIFYKSANIHDIQIFTFPSFF